MVGTEDSGWYGESKRHSQARKLGWRRYHRGETRVTHRKRR